jgi:hypothetical protein
MSRAQSRPLAAAPIGRPLALTTALTTALATALGVLCVAGSATAQPQPMPSQTLQPQTLQAAPMPQQQQPMSQQPAPMAAHHRGVRSAEMNRETIEQRIINLHRALQITPDEESNWTAVAQTMRANEAAMQKLIADQKMERRQGGVTALDDLKTYERFNRAHLDGLKDLIVSFGALYTAMPDAQKAVADHVFQRFNREGLRSNG